MISKIDFGLRIFVLYLYVLFVSIAKLSYFTLDVKYSSSLLFLLSVSSGAKLISP